MARSLTRFLGRPARRVVPLAILLCLVACSGGGTATPLPPTATTAAPSPTVGPSAQASLPATLSAAPFAPNVAVTPGVRGPLTIFAASSLVDAFTDMQTAFQRAYPDVKISINFNASSNLKAQLEQGAQSDLYAPADIPQMDGARGKGLISGQQSIFANNKLALIVPASNPAHITGPQDVAKPGIKLITAAVYVPIGSYARLLFAKMAGDPAYGSDFYTRALANIASEEATARDVVTRISLDEGDAGVVYASDVTPAVAGKVTVIPIPESLQIIAQYPIAVCSSASNIPAAQAFIAFVLSDAGQAILRQWGFLPVPPKSGAAWPLQPHPGVAVLAAA